MVKVWFYAEDGKLYFAYRAHRYDQATPQPMNSTELTAVSASAFDQTGSAITVAQQPSYVASLGAYVGWILGSALAGKGFVSIRLIPTLGPSVPINWAPTKRIDVNVDDKLSRLLAQVPTLSGDVQFLGTAPVTL